MELEKIKNFVKQRKKSEFYLKQIDDLIKNKYKYYDTIQEEFYFSDEDPIPRRYDILIFKDHRGDIEKVCLDYLTEDEIPMTYQQARVKSLRIEENCLWYKDELIKNIKKAYEKRRIYLTEREIYYLYNDKVLDNCDNEFVLVEDTIRTIKENYTKINDEFTEKYKNKDPNINMEAIETILPGLCRTSEKDGKTKHSVNKIMRIILSKNRLSLPMRDYIVFYEKYEIGKLILNTIKNENKDRGVALRKLFSIYKYCKKNIIPDEELKQILEIVYDTLKELKNINAHKISCNMIYSLKEIKDELIQNNYNNNQILAASRKFLELYILNPICQMKNARELAVKELDYVK